VHGRQFDWGGLLPKRTFELLRYALGGDRPSQTAYHALSPIQIMVGSLTGAVSSQSVTEEFEGTLVTVLLSYLLDLSVSQLSTLMPLHYYHDVLPKRNGGVRRYASYGRTS